MLSFGCKQTQDGKHSVAAEKFTITFGAEGCSGGSVNASVDGIGINSGAEVEKGKTIIFTAIPDSGFEAEGWTNAAESPSDKKTATLTVTAAMDVRVRFKEKLFSFPADGKLNIADTEFILKKNPVNSVTLGDVRKHG